MTDIMTMVRNAVLIPYSVNEYGISFGEPFRKEVSVRYNRSNWIDVDMQPIKSTYNTDYIITSQYYIFII